MEASRTLLKNVKITVDDIFVADSKIVTNTVNGDFLYGSDNLIAGKLLDEEYSIKIEGTNKNGIVTKNEIKIPAKNISDTSANITSSSTELNENKYLERLWAYLTLKKLQSSQATRVSNKISLIARKTHKNPVATPNTEMTDEEKAEQLSFKYHFVTNLTSLVITKESLLEENIMSSAPINEELTEIFPTKPSSVVSKMLRYVDPNACVGTLALFSQTYLRGRDRTFTSSEADIGDFSLQVSSIRIAGV